jgi:putative tricarboxylic transport membrane protein
VASRPEAEDAPPRWRSRAAVDAAIAMLASLAGAAVMVDSGRLGAGWANGTPEPGYFPFRIGVLICLSGIVIAVRAFIRARRGAEPFVPWKRFRRVLAVLGPMLAYILATQFLGIYVASALFVAGFMRAAGKYGWLKALVVGAAAAAVLFWLFELKFLVPLPKGPLEHWLGY